MSDSGSVRSVLSTSPSVDEKLSMVLKRSDLDDEGKISLLRESLDTNDWKTLNAKAQYVTGNDTELQADLDSAQAKGGRKARREVILAWQLDPTKGKCYQKMTQSVSADQKWIRPEHWTGRSTFVPTKWTAEEFQKLIDSGRMKEREIASTPGVFEYWDSQELISQKEVTKRRALSGHQSDEIMPETDQSLEFQKKMDAIKGFNLEAMGGASWDAQNAASSSATLALHNEEQLPLTQKKKKAKVAQTPEQKEERKVEAAKKSIENLVKDIRCHLYNNGKKLAKSKEEKLKSIDAQTKELEKLAGSTDTHKELTNKIMKIRNELPK